MQDHKKTPSTDIEVHALQTPSSLPKETESDSSNIIEDCNLRADLNGLRFDVGIQNAAIHSPVTEDPHEAEMNCHPNSTHTLEGDASNGPEFYTQMQVDGATSSGHIGSLNIDGNAIRDWWGLTEHDLEQSDSMNYTSSEMPLWINNFFAIGSLSPSDQLHDLGNPMGYGSFRTDHHTADALSQQYPETTSSSADMSIPGACLLEVTGVGASANQDIPVQTAPRQETGTVEYHNTDKPSPSRGSIGSKIDVQRHRSLPHVLMPPLPEDTYVHEIIERARSNAVSRRMLLDAPTLADFLVDNPTNVLSADLKKYLEPVRRSRRTAEYLGTYWVSYLLLRVSLFDSQ